MGNLRGISSRSIAGVKALNTQIACESSDQETTSGHFVGHTAEGLGGVASRGEAPEVTPPKRPA